MASSIINASKGRKVYDPSLFDTLSPEKWEEAYMATLNPKYRRDKRKFSTKVHTSVEPYGKNPPILLIPRERGGPSYKEVKALDLKGKSIDPKKIVFLPISKGYSMSGLSSFTLGPIVGEGLCLVNSAFSKSIHTFHLEGNGKTDLTKPSFWCRSRKPTQEVVYISEKKIKVDGVVYDTIKYLKDNESEWLGEWEKWSKSVALCGDGSFHWDQIGSKEYPTIGYRHHGEYLNFTDWKKRCYIAPSYELLPSTPEFKYLQELYSKGFAMGLVHPKAKSDTAERPITAKILREMFDSEEFMCCQPFVVTACLLGVEIYGCN